MGLFSHRLPLPAKRQAVIRENGGTFNLDHDYAKQGEKEGWLVYVGYYQLNGLWHSVFKHKL